MISLNAGIVRYPRLSTIMCHAPPYIVMFMRLQNVVEVCREMDVSCRSVFDHIDGDFNDLDDSVLFKALSQLERSNSKDGEENGVVDLHSMLLTQE